jgi:hypothetical protein
MRSHPFKPLRCEFKFIPAGKEDFERNGNSYRWTSEIDSLNAAAELTELITANFGENIPSNDDLNAVCG